MSNTVEMAIGKIDRVSNAVEMAIGKMNKMPNVVGMTIRKIDKVKMNLGKSLGISMPLRDLIRLVRQAKTAAEERAVIEKESANIREAFCNERNIFKCRNMAKLLYIHMLGYPAHFGQIECMKLLGTNQKRFTYIRIGYLGAMLLLDEHSEVLLLVTNCLKSHLNDSDTFVSGLALCTLGSICSNDMCHDLVGEVEKLLKGSSNAYIKKKAALCAFRIIRKVPELLERFVSAAMEILNEKNHGTMVAGISLMIEICQLSNDAKTLFKKMVPNIVRILTELLVSGYTPEYDIDGNNDPILQIKLLQLLRLLGRDDVNTSEEMNEVLNKILLDTKTFKNIGNAILYEAVLTIIAIKSNDNLRRLAVNVLVSFLQNSDNNLRYVALNALSRISTDDLDNVQSVTVVECLKDPDVSIRRRAMELTFALMNGENIVKLSEEILKFLETSDPEFKAECSSRMYVAIEKFSPDSKWHLETMISVLLLAGNHVPDEVISSMIQRISATEDLRSLAVTELYYVMQGDVADAQPLLQIAFWCIGEFGEVFASENIGGEKVSQSDVIDTYERILTECVLTVPTKEYGLTSLAKLADRLVSQTIRISRLLKRYASNMDLELQQRATEYALMIERGLLKHGYLTKMPSTTLISISPDNDNAPVQPLDSVKDIDLLDGISSCITVPSTPLFSTPFDDILSLYGSTKPM